MSTPLYQEALIEARKLREAAAAEAKNAVLEAVSPLIKQMIDKEISGIIIEQEDPMAADAPPPAPPTPSPDAGAKGPIGDVAPPSPMPGMEPAVAKAAPPIAPAGTPVMGKIDVGPGGEQQIVIPVDALFANETTPAETGATAVPPEPAGATPPPAAGPEAAAVAPPPAGPEAAPGAPPATPAPAATPVPGTDPAGAGGAVDPTTGMPINQMVTDPAAAGGAVPPAAPPAAGGPAPPAAGGPAPPAAPPVGDPNAAPPVTPAPTGAAAPQPGMQMEYKTYKTSFELIEQRINSLKNGKVNPSFIKEGFEKQLFGLYQNLIDLKNRNAISPRLFSFNEDRLGLLYENLNVITSYNRNPLTKGKNMANKNSLKDLVHALFEGAEGFEETVGKIDPAGDSEGGDAEHAHRVSGNPKRVRAEAESAPFRTKEKSEWPGKPSPESLLEQLEEEIGELMSEMNLEEEDDEVVSETDDEAVLEFDEGDLVSEARKARSRLRALREQAEEDKLSLTIDLDGVSGSNVSNVNVSLDGESLDVDMEDEDMEEPEMDMSGDEEDMEDEEEIDMSDDKEPDMGEEEPEMEEEEVDMSDDKEPDMGEEEEMEEEEAVEPIKEAKILRRQLHETQLLTARSLFVNKLFVRDDLSGAQKRKIVEYLDSARTLAEAKEVYNRIVRVLNTAKKSGMMNESVEGRRVLGEGAGQIVEPSFDTSRWQILAGVKKSGK